MTYIPNTDADRAEMLKVIGVESVEDLFHDVPLEHRFPEPGAAAGALRDGGAARAGRVSPTRTTT